MRQTPRRLFPFGTRGVLRLILLCRPPRVGWRLERHSVGVAVDGVMKSASKKPFFASFRQNQNRVCDVRFVKHAIVAFGLVVCFVLTGSAQIQPTANKYKEARDLIRCARTLLSDFVKEDVGSDAYFARM